MSSIFHYNSELWTLTETLRSSIDSFHRRLLRTACLNVRWPNTLKNDEVYNTTNRKPWSKVIDERQLRWFGHLIRLSDETPAKLALNYALVPEPKPRGRQKLTWIAMMKKIFSKQDLTWEIALETAKDRKEWAKLIRRFAPD